MCAGDTSRDSPWTCLRRDTATSHLEPYRELVPRRPRSSLPQYGFFHVYSRGVDKTAISRDDVDRTLWVWLLERTIDRFALTCHVYCLMPNHFHLVLEGALEKISSAMHRLNGLHAQCFNDRYDRTGHLFQGRFGIRVIESEAYLESACAYVLDNPVRAGLCESADEWPWSARTF